MYNEMEMTEEWSGHGLLHSMNGMWLWRNRKT